MICFQQNILAQDQEEATPRIWRVDFEGNEQYKDLVLQKYIAAESPSFWKKITFFARDGFEFKEDDIRRDAIRIERFYQRRGYSEAEVDYVVMEGNKPWKKQIKFIVWEGLPIRIRSMELDLNTSEQNSEVIEEEGDYKRVINRLPYREGRVYRPVEEPEVLGMLQRSLLNLGFPYAEANLQAEIDTLARAANLRLQVNTGVRARFDSVKVEGDTLLATRFIVRETGIRKGDWFSERALQEAQREVFKHHMFRLALVSIPDQPQDSTISILMRVKERPLRSVRVRFGAGEFDRLTEPLAFDNFYKLLRTQARWTYRNVRGTGERFTATGRLSFYQRRISAEYLFPYVYNTKSSINITPFYEFRDEENYNILSGGVFTTLGYEYSQDLTATISYELAYNDESNVTAVAGVQNQEILPDSLLSYNVSSIGANLYYTHGLQPGRSGTIVQPSIQLSGLFGESTFSFIKGSLELIRYTELNNSLVLATRVQGGAIVNARQDSLPSDIRFYSGGARTVRGWDRRFLGPKRAVTTIDTTTNPVSQDLRYVPEGGRALLTFNVELRQQLNSFVRGLGVAAFLDGGQVWRRVDDIALSGLQFGVGGGIRYQSPIGPIRADIGYKVNPTPQDLNQFGNVNRGTVWDNWGFHFSIGQAF